MADISKLNLKGTVYNIKDAEARQMINEMPEPMIFKGSLGTGGTVSTLPAASSEYEGFVYKVITEGTYAGQSARVGDLFICNDEPAWILIPSGDDPSGTGTVTNVATGTGLTGGPITTSGTISVDFNAVQAPIADLSTIRAGATAGSTALQSGDSISELNNDSGYLVTSDFKTINNNSVVGTGNISVQDTLVSGTNIKTINNQSLLGSGNLTIESGVSDVQVRGTSVVNAQGVAELNSNFKVFSLSSGDLGDTPSTYTEIREAYDYWAEFPAGTLIFIDNSIVTYAVDDSDNNIIWFQIGYWADDFQHTLFAYNCNYTDTSAAHLVVFDVQVQPLLESGVNIKKINNQSLLGSGNITAGGDTNVIETVKVNNTPLTPDSNKAVNIDLSGYATTSALSNKQDTLVSGTNIKTINNSSILGSGDLSVQPTLVSGTNIKTINNESILGSGNITVEGSEWMLTSSDDGNGTVVLSVASTDAIDADTTNY